MNKNKSNETSKKRGTYIKLAGLILLSVGMITLGILLSMANSSIILILVAAALVLIGLVLIASPEVLIVIVEGISWLP
jgi:hypothetical protein